MGRTVEQRGRQNEGKQEGQAMHMGVRSVRSIPNEGGRSGSEPPEAILAAIVTAVVLLVVAAVLPRSRDAWGIPGKGLTGPGEGQAPGKRTDGTCK